MKRTGFKKKTYEEIIEKKKSKKKILKTKPVKTITKWKKELWTLFSKYIRERDKYTCFTCGKHATGSAMHAGHFITGATCSPLLYFDETNVHAQCYHCNINLSGNWVVYEKKMREKYGDKHVDGLKLRRTKEMGTKVYENFYQEKIEKIKIHLQEML